MKRFIIIGLLVLVNICFGATVTTVSPGAVTNLSRSLLSGGTVTNIVAAGNVTVNSNLVVGGAVIVTNIMNSAGYFSAIITKTTNYTLTAADSTVLLNADTITNTLPTAVGISGRIYIVKVIEATPSNVALTTTSAQTIDGAAPPYNFSVANESIIVQSDGANWQIIGKK